MFHTEKNILKRSRIWQTLKNVFVLDTFSAEKFPLSSLFGIKWVNTTEQTTEYFKQNIN